MGHDSKGSFLEKTLLFDYNIKEIGYPLSKYIIEEYPKLFITRSVRRNAMRIFSKDEANDNINSNILYYKKIFYRTLLQKFLEEYLPEIMDTYGLGDFPIGEENTFNDYIKIAFTNLKTIFINSEDTIKYITELKNKITNEEIDKFYNFYQQCEDILWAVYFIKLKFAKLVEYIVAFDRIIYLQENGIKNIKLIKIFDEKFSVRNLLIYASKI